MGRKWRERWTRANLCSHNRIKATDSYKKVVAVLSGKKLWYRRRDGLFFRSLHPEDNGKKCDAFDLSSLRGGTVLTWSLSFSQSIFFSTHAENNFFLMKYFGKKRQKITKRKKDSKDYFQICFQDKK